MLRNILKPNGVDMRMGTDRGATKSLAPIGAIIALLAPVILSGCDDSSGVGTGTLRVLATDAAISYEMVRSAEVQVTRVEAHTSAEASSGFVTLLDVQALAQDPVTLDLRELTNGLTTELASATVPAGTYRQIRLTFEDASITLENDATYSTDEGTLMLTSQASSGLKIFIDPPLQVGEGLTSSLLLDFDMSHTFRPIPADDPLNATSFQVGPVIRAANMSSGGDITGTVTDSQNDDAPVEGASVYILIAGGDPDVEEDVVTATASEADGSWAVLALPAGSYDVVARHDGREIREDGVVVTVGGVATVDLVLP